MVGGRSSTRSVVMRVAAVDVGTNTALLLIADVEDGRLTPVNEEERFVRLGEGVDASRRIGSAALDRMARALESYAFMIRAAAVDATVVVGTSAARDAANVDDVQRVVQSALEVPLVILSGEDEAQRAFEGAVALLPDLAGPCAVVDVGGGSTELVFGEMAGAQAEIGTRTSVDLGGVRLTERFFHSSPPSNFAVDDVWAFVDDVLAKTRLPEPYEMTLVGTGGTLRSLAMLSVGVASWDEVDGSSLPLELEDVKRWSRRLLSLNTHEVLSLDPRLMGGRADVFPAGVMIMERVMIALGQSRCVVSMGGLKEGVALHAARNNR